MTFVSYCGILSRFMFMSITPDFIGHPVLPFLFLQANMICRFVMARGVGGLPLRRPLSTSGQVRPLASVTSSIVPNGIRVYPPSRPAREVLNAGVAHALRVCPFRRILSAI